MIDWSVNHWRSAREIDQDKKETVVAGFEPRTLVLKIERTIYIYSALDRSTAEDPVPRLSLSLCTLPLSLDLFHAFLFSMGERDRKRMLFLFSMLYVSFLLVSPIFCLILSHTPYMWASFVNVKNNDYSWSIFECFFCDKSLQFLVK